MSASRYLFVVKNPESETFSKSDALESKSIQHHVQISSIHQKKSAGQTKDKSLQALPFIEVKPATTGKLGRFPKGGSLRSSKTPGQATEQLVNPQLGCRCFVVSRTHCPIHAIPRVPVHEGSIIDPFASTRVSIDRQAHTLLQYFVQVSHPRTWDSEVQKDNSYTFARDAETLVRESFEHEVHFYRLLASMASQMQHFDQLNEDESAADSLATRAITTVRKYLQTDPPIVQRLVFDIHELAVVEFYRYQLESARVHPSAVKALLPHIGGIESTDPSLREWIVIGDGFLAAELSAKPLFPASCFDPGDILLDEQTVVTAGSPTGQFLKNPNYHDLIPAKMMGILRDIVTAVPVHERSALETRDSGRSPAILHWLHLRTTALRHRLLELETNDDRVDALRTALVSWIFLVMTGTGRQRTCKVLSAKLRSSLQTTFGKASWDKYEDLLLWMLLTGAMCSSTVDRIWFYTAIRKLQSHQGPAHQTALFSQDLVDLYKHFFYVKKVQGAMLQTCMTELNAFSPFANLVNS
ncbi:hypothetical protein H2200_011325 [Cladophialophora chaetospira]|uniref:Uncharacterized protein n=1 Tax=Cladophialophora chaetospira TaxID=386627 RepID=A0AA39CDQ5_9EURO|nr:hypothetical protein H2200_011325 [Cladophialophora chaetospira]